MVGSAQTGRAQERIARIINALNVDTGRALSMRGFLSGGVLIQAEKGWFLAW
jgi:hypothetical protein